MFAKLESIEQKFETLERQLSDGEIYNDQTRYRALTKAHSDLKDIVATYREHRKGLQELDENKEMLKDGDLEIRAMAEEELERLKALLPELEQRLKILLLPKDPLDEKNVILEVRAGTGGEEAALFAADLFRMYCRFAERKGWKYEILSASESATGGYKEVIATISGDRVYSRLKYESGAHRVQRVPATESQGRIHTSACTVAIMPEAEEVDVDIRQDDLRVEVFRASGPGGQSVNTTDSAVRITHIPTGVVVSCQDEKSQTKNKIKAMKVLRSRILQAEQERQHAVEAENRRALVGSGDRSERIRTYNFPQGRVTDHRINVTIYQLPNFLDGDLDEMLEALVTHYQAEALKSQADAA
ncbi:peptide chain release factor 1 [Megalodesulfovibrio gigas]|uniref:Peptide chain release factor 1 n=1 Tax=Megalodesulfovibrio gigas (strain ATCC 19364 / DSM 1382 / NCIMB 9332 / VKM B-1759) TaxID=1121448 RepID=T2GBC2_MEGG1|nr:peptide chain release factor 1 [Megalodesulfovibrio gigas]AGW13568.1 putative peptide chain release factor 1 [Megalodesulfovibrio gigas DSM 1382 = ATCC 19364]